MLSDKAIFDIAGRAKFLESRLRQRNKQLLRTPKWEDDEIVEKELKGRLRKYVKTKRTQKEILLARLEHLSAVADLAPSISDVWKLINSPIDDEEETT